MLEFNVIYSLYYSVFSVVKQQIFDTWSIIFRIEYSYVDTLFNSPGLDFSK